MRCYIRPMQKHDVHQITEIDREAFPTMWPPPNYLNELSNPLAHYVVACNEEKGCEEVDLKATPQESRSELLSRIKRFFGYDRLLGNESLPSDREYISGFAGFWIMADEAHIINIAVREAHRCQGIGELLLIAVIDLAVKLKARMITLEVRASNVAAQSLYAKYGFTQVGLRRGYYTDDREDGVLMSIEDITSPAFQARFQQLRQAYSEKWGVALSEVAR